jgi:hypothetical protein
MYLTSVWNFLHNVDPGRKYIGDAVLLMPTTVTFLICPGDSSFLLGLVSFYSHRRSTLLLNLRNKYIFFLLIFFLKKNFFWTNVQSQHQTVTLSMDFLFFFFWSVHIKKANVLFESIFFVSVPWICCWTLLSFFFQVIFQCSESPNGFTSGLFPISPATPQKKKREKKRHSAISQWKKRQIESVISNDNALFYFLFLLA